MCTQRTLLLRSVAIACLLLTGCAEPPAGGAPIAAAPEIKNVILMIGDGMGPPEVSLATTYRKTQQSDAKELALERLYRDGAYAAVDTDSFGHVVTDSAAAATAMACGFKTRDGMIGLGPNGERCDSLAAVARRLGKATGLVSTTRVSHATPAPFAADNPSRDDENVIAAQIIDEAKIDVLLNGGARHLLPAGTFFTALPECAGIDPKADGISKRGDDRDLIAGAKKQGYEFACTKSQLDALTKSGAGRILGVFANATFPHIEERRGSPTIPSLPEMTRAAISALAKNPKGFFLMVEGGLIDYAGHENDAGTVLQEVLDFDDAINVALEYIKSHPDTALVVTADHETGGFGVAYRQYIAGDDIETTKLPDGRQYQAKYLSAPFEKVFPALIGQKKSYAALLAPFVDKIYNQGEDPATMTDAFIDALFAATGHKMPPEEARGVLKKEILLATSPLDPCVFASENAPEELHSQKLGAALAHENFCVWATGTHTAATVPLWALGPKAFRDGFAGHVDNTDIYRLLRVAMEEARR